MNNHFYPSEIDGFMFCKDCIAEVSGSWPDLITTYVDTYILFLTHSDNIVKCYFAGPYYKVIIYENI